MLIVYQSVLILIIAFVPLVTNSHKEIEMNGTAFRFSTKTPYIFKESNKLFYKDFKPTRIWAIYRHGTRLPGKKIISKYFGLVNFIDSLQNSSYLTNDEKIAFKSWKPLDINLDHQKFLTKEGEEELYNLGIRFRENYLHNFDVNHVNFTFKHTPTQRTNISARKFMEGLFNGTSDRLHEPIEVPRDDPVLRPYKGCPLWRKKVKKNPDTLAEKRGLIQSSEVENLVNELRELTQIQHLDFNDVELIYTMCGFETAWRHLLYNNKSIWCSLFKNDRHLEIMEYLEDMEYYWIDGPGHEITRKVACKTVDDLINHLDPTKDEQKLSFYFTHSGTILKLLTFLELYDDNVNLTTDKLNYQRLWRTSLIDTFSTNIIAILYDSKIHGPHIQVLHQENIINIPKCGASNEYGMYKYDDFKNYYGQKIKDCNLSIICNENEEL